MASSPPIPARDAHPKPHVSEATAATPLVSVVIPAYNCAAYLARSINSALSQTYPHIECIVVDDGSSDQTPEVIRSFGHRVRSVRQVNGGASAARNTGIDMAKGRYIAFLDADDYWLPTKIENQIEVCRRHPGLALVWCGFTPDLSATINEPPKTGPAFDAQAVQVFDSLTQLFREPALGTWAVLADTEVIRSIHGFDTSLPIAEDIDLFFRLCHGRRYAHLAQRLVGYQWRPGSLTTSGQHSYEHILRVFDRVERTMGPLAEGDSALLRFQRLKAYDNWIRGLLVCGAGREARRVLRLSRQVGKLPQHHWLYAKSWAAPLTASLRQATAALRSSPERLPGSGSAT